MGARSVALIAESSTVCMGDARITSMYSSVMHGRWNIKMRSINQFSLKGCAKWPACPIRSVLAPLGRTLGVGSRFVTSVKSKSFVWVMHGKNQNMRPKNEKKSEIFFFQNVSLSVVPRSHPLGQTTWGIRSRNSPQGAR